jgi:tetratricopeptide (TPR) repeat protein
LAAALLLPVASSPAAAPQAVAGEALEKARALVEAERFDEAGAALEPLFQHGSAPAEAYLLRSSVLLVQGDFEAGRRDLERALELDPGLRQAWLNRAALDMAEGRLDQALTALEQARTLDPTAADSALNIGAVLLQQGKVEAAQEQFAEYLERVPASADAEYLVASNFAMGGLVDSALTHLRQAIALDERSRLRARTDVNFTDFSGNPGFEELLSRDAYRLPAGAHHAALTFEAAYDQGHGKLLQAVMNAVQGSARPVEHQVEVTPEWALIWSDMRIKVSAEDAERGRVELSAPADRFSTVTWAQETDRLFREIAAQLIQLNRPF